MINKTSNNNKLYAIWERDQSTKEVYLVIESETYPLRLKLDTISDSFAKENITLIKKGVEELLSKLNVCCQCCDKEAIASDVVTFLTNPDIAASTLKQWFQCRYEAVYE